MHAKKYIFQRSGVKKKLCALIRHSMRDKNDFIVCGPSRFLLQFQSFCLLLSDVITQMCGGTCDVNSFQCCVFCSQSIFSAVAYYMKHLGVKTRAVDSKKSRGGFFRSKLVKVKAGRHLFRPSLFVSFIFLLIASSFLRTRRTSPQRPSPGAASPGSRAGLLATVRNCDLAHGPVNEAFRSVNDRFSPVTAEVKPKMEAEGTSRPECSLPLHHLICTVNPRLYHGG